MPGTADRPRLLVSMPDPEVQANIERVLAAAGLAITRQRAACEIAICGRLAHPRVTHDVILVVAPSPLEAQAGLDAFLSHGCVRAVMSLHALERIPAAVEACAHGALIVDCPIRDAATSLPRLAPRERRVLELLASGAGNTDISRRLHVSPATVKRDVHGLCRLLDARNRTELAARAGELGWGRPE